MAFSLLSIYSELLAHGILKPLEAAVEGLRDVEGTKNYVTPAGMSSIAKHFLKESGDQSINQSINQTG